jgi:hypothetical protein
MNKLNVCQGKQGEWTFLPYHLPAGVKGRCDYGQEILVSDSNLRSGKTTSCGCFKPDGHGRTASGKFAG